MKPPKLSLLYFIIVWKLQMVVKTKKIIILTFIIQAQHEDLFMFPFLCGKMIGKDILFS